MPDSDAVKVNVERIDKSTDSQQLADPRASDRAGLGKKPPYNPDLLASFLEKNETHSVAVRKKARYEVGYGFDFAPVDNLRDDEDASDEEYEVVRHFWRSRESRWQTGPQNRAEPTVPEEVLELARQDYHAIGWACLEILTDNMGRPVGLAHVPANTVRVRTPQSQYDQPRHPETGAFIDSEEARYASRGYVQKRQSKRRYFGEAGDRYRGHEPNVTVDDDGNVSYRLERLRDEDREPIFVDKHTGDVQIGSAEGIDPANELIFIKNPSPLADDYGIPDWVSAIRTISADEAAKDYNREFFENDTIPRMVIKVTGGTLSEESKRDLRKMIQDNREESHRTTLLELEQFNEELNDDVEIELEPLGQGVTEEMSFASFRQKNEHEVAKVHEIPPLLIGVTESSNRANSREQVHAFATEVIQPEQHKFAERLYQLIHQTAFGVTDWTLAFTLRGADQPREDARTASEKINAVQGAIPVNRALEMIGEEPLDGDRGDMLIADIGTDADPEIDTVPGGGTFEADRPDYLPPKNNKAGEIDYEEVKTQLEVDGQNVAQKDPIEQVTFNSSNLDRGLYDFETQDLFISFKRDGGDNSLYVYTGVTASTWQGLVNASSHGEFHHANIRLSIPYLEVTNFHERLPQGPAPSPEDVPEGIPSEI